MQAFFCPQHQVASSLESVRRQGTANMTGELFEVKMAMFLFLKGMFETENFILDTNVDWAGAFDDLVFCFQSKKTKQKHVCFIQLKHRETRHVSQQDLCKDYGDFSLLKYFDSYCQIKDKLLAQMDDTLFKESFAHYEFIIYTNSSLGSKQDKNRAQSFARDKSIVTRIENCDIGTIVNTGGQAAEVFSIITQKTESILKKLKDYEEILKEISTADISDEEKKNKVKGFEKLNHNKYLVKLMESPAGLDEKLWYEFLDKLKLFTCQAAEWEFDSQIRDLMIKYCGTNKFYKDLQDSIIEWWRNGEYKLTEWYASFWWSVMDNPVESDSTTDQKDRMNSTITQSSILSTNTTRQTDHWNPGIMEKHLLELVKPISKKLSAVSELRFKVKLDVSRRVTQVITDGCTELSCLKVQQSLAGVGHIIIDVSTLRTRTSEVLAMWEFGSWCKVLVLDGEIQNGDIDGLTGVLNRCPEKQVVVVSNNFTHQLTELCSKSQRTSLIESCNLFELCHESQEKIIKCKVKFQGNLIALRHLSQVALLQDVVTPDITVQLLSGHQVLEVGCEPDNLDKNYITRTLFRKEFVVQNFIFSDISNAVVAVTGFSDQELQLLTQNTSPDKKVSFVTVNNDSEFNFICDKNENVHWIEKNHNKFTWKHSKGDFSQMRKYLEEEILHYNIEDILELSQRLVLVVAESHMGKSTEMSYVAHRVKQIDPTMWLVRVDLNKYTTYLSQDQIDVMGLLFKAVEFDTEFQRQLLEHEVWNGGNVVVILDGCDEVYPRHSEKLLSLIRKLLHTKIRSIYLTSRPIMQELLEREFDIRSFHLLQFTQEDHVKYLSKFWESSIPCSQNLKEFISALLKLFEGSYNKILTGIPLQARILAKDFENAAQVFSESKIIVLPKTLDLLYFFQKFLDIKWEKYYEKSQLDLGNELIKDRYDVERHKSNKNLMKCALVTFFDSEEIQQLHKSKKILEQIHDILEEYKTHSDRLGIITDVFNDKAVFVHQIFIEYFVALWFFKYLKYNLEFFKTIYNYKNTESKYKTVCKFFDYLTTQEHNLHKAVLNEDVDMIKSVLAKDGMVVNAKDDAGRTALHLAISNLVHSDNKMIDIDSTTILKILLDHKADPNIEDIFQWSPLCLAVELEAWDVVSLLKEGKIKQGTQF